MKSTADVTTCIAPKNQGKHTISHSSAPRKVKKTFNITPLEIRPKPKINSPAEGCSDAKKTKINVKLCSPNYNIKVIKCIPHLDTNTIK